jgi:hypothetical protein
MTRLFRRLSACNYVIHAVRNTDTFRSQNSKASAAAAYAEAARVPEENKILAALGVKTLLKMLIDDNFLHADLHPGNILVRLKSGGLVGGVVTGDDKDSDVVSATRRSQSSKKASSSVGIKPEIVILDTGLATELTPHQQASLAEFFQAIISWDGAGVAEKIISFSSNLSPTLDLASFKQDIAVAVGKFAETTPRAGDCMAAIFETVQQHHVTIDPNVMVAVVTVMVLEGWQFRLGTAVGRFPNPPHLRFISQLVTVLPKLVTTPTFHLSARDCFTEAGDCCPYNVQYTPNTRLTLCFLHRRPDDQHLGLHRGRAEIEFPETPKADPNGLRPA